MSHKFRASYTVLNTWMSGNWERAIKQYFKLEKFTTPAMADGKRYHEMWEQEIITNKRLPAVFGGKELTNPKPEYKTVVELEPWLDLVGVIDCYDEPTIHEFKTGITSSEVYAGSMQPGVYAVLATMNGMYADRAQIWHYDQYSKKVDISQVWLTDKRLKQAQEWIVALSSEMHDYFLENKLYERFQA